MWYELFQVGVVIFFEKEQKLAGIQPKRQGALTLNPSILRKKQNNEKDMIS